MIEIYAAAEVSELAFKSNDLIARDLEGRFGPVLLSELQKNFPDKIEYDAAESTLARLVETVDQGFEYEVLKGDFHLVKIKVHVDVEIVNG